MRVPGGVNWNLLISRIVYCGLKPETLPNQLALGFFHSAIRNQQSSILLSSPFSADPIIPNAVGLEHLNAMGIAHRLLNLLAGEARTDFFG